MFPRRFTCTRCKEQIELDDNELSLSEVVCPSCNSPLQYGDIETTRIPVFTRLLSMFIDYCILIVVAIVFAIPQILYEMLGPGPAERPGELFRFDPVADSGGWIFFSLIGFALFYCKDAFDGRSPAKRILGLQLVGKSSGAPARPLQTLLRNVTVIFSPIELIAVLINPGRRLGDVIAGTKLVTYEDQMKAPNRNYRQILISFAIAYSGMMLILGAMIVASRPNHGAQAQSGKNDQMAQRLSLKVGDTIDVNSGRVYHRGDTTLQFRFNGNIVPTIVQKTETRFFRGFQTYLDTHSPESLSYHNVEMADVTGDGLEDSCVTRIVMLDSYPFIEHTVISGSRRVFYDTLTLNDPYELLWEGDEESYYALKPLSSMYIAEDVGSTFVGDSVSGVDKNWSYFLAVLHPGETEKWNGYLSNYKGRWIWSLALVSNSALIWDSTASRFIEFWGP
jgi:uncharacterized RDD family membrane protein YckC